MPRRFMHKFCVLNLMLAALAGNNLAQSQQTGTATRSQSQVSVKWRRFAGKSSGNFRSSSVPPPQGSANSINFLPAETYSSNGQDPNSVAIADVNGDHIPDLVVSKFSGINGPSVDVFLGNGDGTFKVTASYSAASGGSVLLADVNGDGKIDIVLSVGKIEVFLGNGDGTFQEALDTPSNGGTDIALADLNGDGKLDAVIYSPAGVGIQLGNGNGTFQTQAIYPMGGPVNGPGSVAISDLNGDGKPDLIVAVWCASDCSLGTPTEGGVFVLFGNGNGTFQPAVASLSGGDGAISVAVGDLNGDGIPDILTANCGPGACSPASPGGVVGVLLGNGNGTFQPAVSYPAGNCPYAITVADVDGDGKLDAVVGNWGSADGSNFGTISVLLGNGNGTFQSPVLFLSGGDSVTSVAVADLNGDGKPDIAAIGVTNNGQAQPSPGIVGILLNGNGSSQAPTNTTLISSLPTLPYGHAVTFTAQVTAGSGTPTGIVVFSSGSTTIGSAFLTNGKAAVSIPLLPVGYYLITAAYQGQIGFVPSTSAPVVQIVDSAPTTTSLTSTVNPVGDKRNVTFIATVADPYGDTVSGMVEFTSSNKRLGVVSVGVAPNQAYLRAQFPNTGTYSIVAKYIGDSNNIGSTSAALIQTVLTYAKTTLVSSPNPSVAGQAVTFTATVASAEGPPSDGEIVTFNNGPAVLGTALLSAGKASFTTSSLPVGILAISASYAGDANLAPSTSLGHTQTVNSATKSATSTSLTSTPNPSTYGQDVAFIASVTSAASSALSGKIRFKDGSGQIIGTMKLNTDGSAVLSTSALDAGFHPVTAVYSGDVSNLSSSSRAVNQVVQQTTSSATITSSQNPSAPGQTVTFTVNVSSPTVVPTGPVTFSIGKIVLGTSQLSGGSATFTTSSLPAGSNRVTVTYAGDSNIAKSSAFVVQKLQ
jgi:hypothetical protein